MSADKWNPPWESSRNIGATDDEQDIAERMLPILREQCKGDVGRAEHVLRLMSVFITLTKADSYKQREPDRQ